MAQLTDRAALPGRIAPAPRTLVGCGMEGLDRDRRAELAVFAAIDHAHPAGADAVENAIVPEQEAVQPAVRTRWPDDRSAVSRRRVFRSAISSVSRSSACRSRALSESKSSAGITPASRSGAERRADGFRDGVRGRESDRIGERGMKTEVPTANWLRPRPDARFLVQNSTPGTVGRTVRPSRSGETSIPVTIVIRFASHERNGRGKSANDRGNCHGIAVGPREFAPGAT